MDHHERPFCFTSAGQKSGHHLVLADRFGSLNDPKLTSEMIAVGLGLTIRQIRLFLLGSTHSPCPFLVFVYECKVPQACRMSLKRGRDALREPDLKNQQDANHIFESLPIEDRDSKFVGLFSSVVPAKELQAHAPYKNASHRILAWRKPSNQQSLTSFKTTAERGPKPIYTTGSDDDGEKYAGKKLEKLLIDLDIVGSVVVARWYGGTLLGPVRFTHMEQVARDAIVKWRESQGITVSSKKTKTEPTPDLTPEQEAEQRVKLVKLLNNRDNSIKVLRGLLAEKKVAKAENSASSSTPAVEPPASTPSATIDYSPMPLSKLKQLEKAKDTTIAWILKQIDEAEADVPPKSVSIEPGKT